MRRLSLQARLVALVVLAYALLGGASALFFVELARRWSRDDGYRFAAREALLQRSRVKALLGPEVALARKLADDPAVVRWAGSEGDPALRGAALASLESYRRALRDHTWFLALASSGHYYYSDAASAKSGSPRVTSLDRSTPSDRWFFEALAAGAPFQLNLDFNATFKVAKVFINVPLREPASGEVLGIAGSGLDVTDFLSEVGRAATRPRPCCSTSPVRSRRTRAASGWSATPTPAPPWVGTPGQPSAR